VAKFLLLLSSDAKAADNNKGKMVLLKNTQLLIIFLCTIIYLGIGRQALTTSWFRALVSGRYSNTPTKTSVFRYQLFCMGVSEEYLDPVCMY
jgi:hypothetical protein